MRRRTLDALLATSGLIVAAILLAAGGLLTWAHNFVGNEVYTQLSSQQIFFPAKGSDSLNDPAIKPYLEQYAGQQMTNGAQAKAYADHFIAVHINEMTGGKTYAELGGAQNALKAQIATAKAANQPTTALDEQLTTLNGTRETSSRARPCAACCSTPTPSTPWAASPASPPSPPSASPA